jgi:hypothetical protein
MGAGQHSLLGQDVSGWMPPPGNWMNWP